ncbi:MAG: P83/100 family protein [Spirochaetales bacterium]
MRQNNAVRLTIVVILTILSFQALPALDVAEEELSRVRGQDIEFVNYEGPVSTSESVEMIRSIGEFLGERELSAGETREYFERYLVERAIDPDTSEGFDADIFIILPGARVDHIRNLRLMLSGYLESAYGYSGDEADLIAELSTVYNAVYRGDLSNFEQRYKPVVHERLSADSVGLSTVYSEWAGNTELVIPLREGQALVDPFELADEVVIGDLRERSDMGIAERRSLVSLMEDVIDIERDQIESDRERFAADLDALEEREREILQEREELDALRASERAQGEERIDRAEAELSDRMAALSARAEEIEERDAEVEEMEEQVQAERDAIAEDREEVLDEDEVDTEDVDEVEQADDEDAIADPENLATAERSTDSVDLIEVTGSEANPEGRIARVSVDDGRVSERSQTDRISSRELSDFRGSYLVIAGVSENTGNLVRIDQDELAEQDSSSEEVFIRSSVEVVDDAAIFAVIRHDERWKMGRFSPGLELESMSEAAVAPNTSIGVHESSIVVQADDDTFIVLSRDNLRRQDTDE